jgi:DNA-binding CsgD family transcriptional regulator
MREALTADEIARVLDAWKEERRRLWDDFQKSLSPEQADLFRQYHRAARTTRRLSRWLDRAERGDVIRRRLPLPPGMLLASHLNDLAIKIAGSKMACAGPGFAQALALALGDLDRREREVVELHYGLRDGRKHTLAEIAAEWGVSRERVRQIKARALRRLRHPKRGLQRHIIL